MRHPVRRERPTRRPRRPATRVPNHRSVGTTWLDEAVPDRHRIGVPGQYGGQGIAGRSGSGWGKRPVRQERRQAERGSPGARPGRAARPGAGPAGPRATVRAPPAPPARPARWARRATPTGRSAAWDPRRSTRHGPRRTGGAAGLSGRPARRPAGEGVARHRSAVRPPRAAGESRQTGRIWPPLRSVLLTTASKRAIRRNRRSEVRTRSQGWTAGSGSIHSWTIPRPNGPSRRTVGGHDRPAARVGDQRRGDLPIGQRAVGEVPQRSLEADRLVDRRDLQRTGPEAAIEGGVG